MSLNVTALKAEFVKVLTFRDTSWNADYSANKIVDKEGNYIADKNGSPVVYES